MTEFAMHGMQVVVAYTFWRVENVFGSIFVGARRIMTLGRSNFFNVII